MKALFQKLFDIREAETQKALLMFLYIFLLIASLLIVKPVSSSIFLNKFGEQQLPYVFMLVAVVAGLVTQVYSRITNKIRLNLLIYFTTIFSMISLAVFWILLEINIQQSWFYYFFYVWVAIFGITTTSQFWLLANYVFNAREAKRLFGFIGAGAISGGIFGGFLTSFLAEVLGTNNMIFFCLLFLGVCSWILKKVWKGSARFAYKEHLLQQQKLRRTEFKKENPFLLILRSKHLLYLAGIIGIGVMVATLVDYQFKAIAYHKIQSVDRLTAFFGLLFSSLSIASLLIQLFLTGKILKKFGVSTSLVFLPAGIMVGALLTLINPALWAAVILKISEGGFKQSINKAGLELLLLPVPSDIKNKTKTYIDILVDSLATGIAGLLLLVFTKSFGFSVQHISLMMIVFILLWLFLLVKMKQEYINSFRTAIEKRFIDLASQTVNLDDVSILGSFSRIFEGENIRQISYVLQLLENVKADSLVPYYRKLIHHHSAEIRLRVLNTLKMYENLDFSDEILKLVSDEQFEIQVEAIRYLCCRIKNKKEMLKVYLNDQDIKIQCAALLATAYEAKINPNLHKEINIKVYFNEFTERFYSQEVSTEKISFVKAKLAQFIGIIKESEFSSVLIDLLNDSSFQVTSEAITAAGTILDRSFIPILVDQLKNKQTRSLARAALSKFGEQILDVLFGYFESPETEKKIQYEIPKILTLIGTQKVVDYLCLQLNQKNLTLRYRIIKTLNKIRQNDPELKFNKKGIDQNIYLEIEEYQKMRSFLELQYRMKNSEELSKIIKSLKYRKIQNLVIRTVEERLSSTIERIFRLLGLRYSATDIYNTYLAFMSEKKQLKANAIEFLDNILDSNFKKSLIPIIEEQPLSFTLQKFIQRNQKQNLLSDLNFEQILYSKDNWLRACTIYMIGEMDYRNPIPIIKQLSTAPDPVLHESVVYTLKRFSI
jgi:AAA family ATP:ADP antiporter